METMTKEQVKERVVRGYAKRGWEKEMERELVDTPSYCEYGGVGAVLLAVRGTPPRGYALYIPRYRRLVYYDSSGRGTGSQDNIILEGYE